MKTLITVVSIGMLAVLCAGCASTPAIGPFSYMAKQHTEKQRMYRAAALTVPADKMADAAAVIESGLPVVAKQKAISAWATGSGEGAVVGIGVNLLALPDITVKEAGLEILGAIADIGTYYALYSGIDNLTQSSSDHNRSGSVNIDGNNNSVSVNMNETTTTSTDNSDDHSDNRTGDGQL